MENRVPGLGTRFFFPRGEALIFWGKVGTILYYAMLLIQRGGAPRQRM